MLALEIQICGVLGLWILETIEGKEKTKDESLKRQVGIKKSW